MNWLAYAGIGLTLATSIFNGVIFILLKFNDLKHLELSVKELKDNIHEYGNKVELISERIAKMEGICSVCAKKARIAQKR
jgi:hypothetical protein